MTERARRDPDIRPRGWDRESSYAPWLAFVSDRDAVTVDVTEAATPPLTPNAGFVVLV
jgi:hypothetical protein